MCSAFYYDVCFDVHLQCYDQTRSSLSTSCQLVSSHVLRTWIMLSSSSAIMVIYKLYVFLLDQQRSVLVLFSLFRGLSRHSSFFQKFLCFIDVQFTLPYCDCLFIQIQTIKLNIALIFQISYHIVLRSGVVLGLHMFTPNYAKFMNLCFVIIFFHYYSYCCYYYYYGSHSKFLCNV